MTLPAYRISPSERAAMDAIALPQLTARQRVMKRAIDVIAGSALLVLAAPILLISALVIRLDSDSPSYIASVVGAKMDRNSGCTNCIR